VWAHSRNDAEVRHALEDHLRGTAGLAARFATPFGAGRLAWWLGLLHDVGKASCAWQDRLVVVEGTKKSVGLDHKLLGTRLATERGLGKFAMAILGHHGGLDTPQDLGSRLRKIPAGERAALADAEDVVRRLLPELAGTECASTGQAIIPAAWRTDPLVAEMGLRLVFSALCDADYLDTAAHFAGAAVPAVGDDRDFGVLCERFERARREMLRDRPSSKVNGEREEVYRACVRAAALPRGVFRLAAPTGAGKTIAAGGFAVHHAATHSMRRVIVAVPFLTITEQNAGRYRELLDEPGDDVVLEHHSGVDMDRASLWTRLAAENWDAPFIVTTTVRLFESLFDRRPAAMRRLHRLSGAVIVLDEVQSLPHQMLVPILNALRALVDHFGATVLLSSATQPDFWQLSPFADLSATEIIKDPAVLGSRMRRVCFDWRTEERLTLADVATDAAAHPQAMVIVNTTADAKTVFGTWRQAAAAGQARHLSTRMCPAHRRRVLADVLERLANREPVLLVTTQLIEAGVDIDFPVVYRAMAPADSLLQAAGRANREGTLPHPGLVIIVDPSDAGSPPAYKTLTGSTRIHFGAEKADPDNLAALHAYYRSVYGALNLDHPASTGKRIQAARRKLDFPAVTDGPLILDAGDQNRERPVRDRTLAFRMITDEGIVLVTPRGAKDDAEREAMAALADHVRTAARPDRDDLRKLQPYSTTVHRSALRRPGVSALICPIIGEAGQPGSLAEWTGDYDKDTGIELDPRIEDFVT
jgi:CRISPR-associated endonuclease/helicase Cas3